MCVRVQTNGKGRDCDVMEMLRGAVGEFHDVSLDSSKEKKIAVLESGVFCFFFSKTSQYSRKSLIVILSPSGFCRFIFLPRLCLSEEGRKIKRVINLR